MKEKLIHWLGGFTENEYFKDTKDSFDEGVREGRRVETDESDELARRLYGMGCRDTRKKIRNYADSLYGLPAEEWCQKMYEYLK